ncbi:integrative conjugative element protein, RAQPRD family [Cedecea neteri]|uniref:Integrative conjugative element protein, RAQPRD family n=1 Tax=Cedecea neteri TaxID=158822 RepID=A0A2X2TF86_9ENTR|nr:integrative conjugative element protein, RAQPRD family [Cedecea neteri]
MDELASTQRLLDQAQASLERARVAAAQADPAERGRFYFDYLRATTDLNTVRAGIDHYLTPSRGAAALHRGRHRAVPPGAPLMGMTAGQTAAFTAAIGSP